METGRVVLRISQWRRPVSAHRKVLRRRIHWSSSPSSISYPPSTDSSDVSDARLEVLGNASSLLSVDLSAKQHLYTRRGSLVGLAGATDEASSTLRVFSPIRRVLSAQPFLYQHIQSTSPLTLLVSPVRSNHPNASIALLRLTGTTDFILPLRLSLLAWTGHALNVRPLLPSSLRTQHWGSQKVTGRGLVALVATGGVHVMELEKGEKVVLHPSHVVAYSVGRQLPVPYRLSSRFSGLQVPSFGLPLLLDPISESIKSSRFIRVMRGSETWKGLGRAWWKTRVWMKAVIWGDRLMMQFQGPGMVLVQSRGQHLRDVLGIRETVEIADAEPAAARQTGQGPGNKGSTGAVRIPKADGQGIVREITVKIGQGGKASFAQSSGA